MISAKTALEMSDSSVSLSSYCVTEFSKIESLITTEAKSGGKSIKVTFSKYDGEGHEEFIVNQLKALGYAVRNQGSDYMIYWDKA